MSLFVRLSLISSAAIGSLLIASPRAFAQG
jgi:hypothetical protein